MALAQGTYRASAVFETPTGREGMIADLVVEASGAAMFRVWFEEGKLAQALNIPIRREDVRLPSKAEAAAGIELALDRPVRVSAEAMALLRGPAPESEGTR
jgi:hypothetical protein